jgi:hypothetical protein
MPDRLIDAVVVTLHFFEPLLYFGLATAAAVAAHAFFNFRAPVPPAAGSGDGYASARGTTSSACRRSPTEGSERPRSATSSRRPVGSPLVQQRKANRCNRQRS